MGISTHILDTSTGRPAAGVPVRVERREGEDWRELAAGHTDADGRLRALDSTPPHGTYRITFTTSAHLGVDAFFPEVQIVFVVRDERHHHVPLLLSPFGYSTYRGS
jgi:5-hydroxyisourate hydrolase